MAILVTQCKAKAWEKASILLIFDQLRLSFQTAILCSRIGGLEITLDWVTRNIFSTRYKDCFWQEKFKFLLTWLRDGLDRNMALHHTNGDSWKPTIQNNILLGPETANLKPASHQFVFIGFLVASYILTFLWKPLISSKMQRRQAVSV